MRNPIPSTVEERVEGGGGGGGRGGGGMGGKAVGKGTSGQVS